MEIGDSVNVLDTSNNKILSGYVRKLEQGKTQVWIDRFKNLMWFESDGTTRLGRFKLMGRA